MILPSPRPVLSRIGSRAFGARLRDAAHETIEIEPASLSERQAVVASPDEAGRIRAFREGLSPTAMAEMNEPIARHSATIAYRIDDTIIADATVMTRRAIDIYAEDRRRWLLTGLPERVDEAQLCTNWVTERYFGHWVCDGWQREQLAVDRTLRPLTLGRNRWPHEAGYRSLVGLTPHVAGYARVGRLWLVDDNGLNDGRVARMKRMSERLRVAVGEGSAERVFISRGKLAVGRSLANEEEVADALERRGFLVLAPEELDPANAARAVSRARMIVTVEGSAAFGAMMAMPPRSGMLILQAPFAFNTMIRFFSDRFGQRFGYVVGDPAEGETFVQPIDRLLRTVDLMENALA